MFDESLDAFIPSSSTAKVSYQFSEGGLPPMVTVISDPVGPKNWMEGRVRPWKQVNFSRDFSLAWRRADHDNSMQDTTVATFQGEEDLVPDSIPDGLWQSHFRQHDAELNDRRETEYLLQLYKRTCGRWPVIYDRWQMHPVYGLRGKSLESLKSKFNKVAMKLFEIDLLQQKQPASTVERIQICQQLKYLPLFAVKYNEKNEFLRRLFMENALKKNPHEFEKQINEILRIPTISMKKKSAYHSRIVSVPGPQLASSLVPVSVQGELSASEYSRVKAVLLSLGIDRSRATATPKLAKLFATVEKEVATLLMMRDSLQRKKQELEILRTNGGVGAVGGGGIRPRVGSSSGSVNVQGVQSISVSHHQHKRKR
jgi:hypothetical protein